MQSVCGRSKRIKRGADAVVPCVFAESQLTIEALQQKVNFHGREVERIRGQLNGEKAPNVISVLKAEAERHAVEYYLHGRNLEKLKRQALEAEVVGLKTELGLASKKAKEEFEFSYDAQAQFKNEKEALAEELRKAQATIADLSKKVSDEEEISQKYSTIFIEKERALQSVTARHTRTKQAYGAVLSELEEAKKAQAKLLEELTQKRTENEILKASMTEVSRINAELTLKLDAIARLAVSTTKVI